MWLEQGLKREAPNSHKILNPTRSRLELTEIIFQILLFFQKENKEEIKMLLLVPKMSLMRK